MTKTLLFIFLIAFPFLLQAQSINISTDTNVVCNGMTITFTASVTNTPAPHYHWKVNSISSGTDSSGFSTSLLNNGDVISCALTNGSITTVIATSSTTHMTVQTPPYAGIITGPDSQVCVGATIMLSDSVPGGVWSASNSEMSVSNGTVTGIRYLTNFEAVVYFDTIRYLVSNSCGIDTASKRIAIRAIQDAYFELPGPMCQGQSYSYYSGDGEGSFVSGNFYSTTGNAITNSSSVYCATPGPDIIYHTTSNTCGRDTFSVGIRIKPKPVSGPITLNELHVCVGAQITITDPGLAYYSESWSSTKGKVSIYAVGTDRNGFHDSLAYVTGVSSGIDTIIWSTIGICGSAAGTAFITVDPPDSITVPGAVCVGQTMMITNAVPGGTWSVLDQKKLAIDAISGTATGLVAGVDTVYYSLANGCKVPKAITVNIAPGPVIGDDVVCYGSSIMLSDSTVGGNWWTYPSDVIDFDRFYPGQLDGLKKGIAYVNYTLPNGCSSIKGITSFDCNEGIIISPNPARERMVIEADTDRFNNLLITDCLGRTMMNRAMKTTFTEVDVSLWSAGVYIVHLSGPHATSTNKVVKE